METNFRLHGVGFATERRKKLHVFGRGQNSTTYLIDKDWLPWGCQKGCEELAAILWVLFMEQEMVKVGLCLLRRSHNRVS
jgi:hypothetical protein